MQKEKNRFIEHLTNTKIKKTILVFLSILLLNSLISLTTGYNFFLRSYYFISSIVNGYTKEEKEITIKNELYTLNIKADWINDKQIKATYTVETNQDTFSLFEIEQKLNQAYFTDFYLLTENDQAKIEKNTLTWNLNKELNKGEPITLELQATIKEKQIDYQGFFPFYHLTTIKTQLPEENRKEIKSKEKILLKNGYQVNFHWNTPSSCESQKEIIKTYHAFETADVIKNIPKCKGYTFVGWENEEQLTKINSSKFIMPTKDISLNGVWESLSLAKRITITKASYEVNFYIEDEKLKGEEKYIQVGENYGTLPKIEKEGLNFDGWYTKDNILIESTTPLIKEEDHNLYAHFSKKD